MSYNHNGPHFHALDPERPWVLTKLYPGTVVEGQGKYVGCAWTDGAPVFHNYTWSTYDLEVRYLARSWASPYNRHEKRIAVDESADAWLLAHEMSCCISEICETPLYDVNGVCIAIAGKWVEGVPEWLNESDLVDAIPISLDRYAEHVDIREACVTVLEYVGMGVRSPPPPGMIELHVHTTNSDAPCPFVGDEEHGDDESCHLCEGSGYIGCDYSVIRVFLCVKTLKNLNK